MWLPALGAALFVGVGLWWAVTPAAPAIAADQEPSASASAAAPPPTAAAQAPTVHPHPVPNAIPIPSALASAMPSGRPAMGAAPPAQGSEERMRRLRDRFNQQNAGGHP